MIKSLIKKEFAVIKNVIKKDIYLDSKEKQKLLKRNLFYIKIIHLLFCVFFSLFFFN